MFLDQEEEEAPHRVYKFTITACYPCEQNIPYGCVENFLNEMNTVYIPIHPQHILQNVFMDKLKINVCRRICLGPFNI